MIGRDHGQRIKYLVWAADEGSVDASQYLWLRIHEVYSELEATDDNELAEAVADWYEARREEWSRSESIGSDEGEAPAYWIGGRVKVVYAALRGIARPIEVRGSLRDVTERGVVVRTDDLVESSEGPVVRREMGERLICWTAVLSITPLPERQEIYVIEQNIRAHEEAVDTEVDVDEEA